MTRIISVVNLVVSDICSILNADVLLLPHRHCSFSATSGLGGGNHSSLNKLLLLLLFWQL